MEFFIEKGFNFEQWAPKLMRLLALLAKTYDMPKLTQLLESRGYKASDEEYLLASRWGNVKVLESLSSVAIERIRDLALNTLLHLAAAYGHLKAVSSLLSKGADSRATNRKGLTASHMAALQDHSHVLFHITKHEASCLLRGC